MRGKQLYYFLIIFFLLVLVLAGFGFYYAVFENLEQENQSADTTRNPAQQNTDSQKPHVELLFSNGKLFLTWDHLPPDAKTIRILRAQKGGGVMAMWKLITLPTMKDASVQIESGKLEDLNNYEYRFEINSDSGRLFSMNTEVSISSTYSNLLPRPAIQPNNQSVPGSNPAIQEEGQASSSFIPQQNIPLDSSPFPTGQTAPSGQTPQSPDAPAPNFWVSYVNQKIEFGWQGLPSSTTLIKLLRSKGADGPWSQILKQTNPVLSEPYKLHIVDQGQNENFYYKLQSYSGSRLLESYGPIYLPFQQ